MTHWFHALVLWSDFVIDVLDFHFCRDPLFPFSPASFLDFVARPSPLGSPFLFQVTEAFGLLQLPLQGPAFCILRITFFWVL